MKILIIDDDYAIRSSVEILLNSKNYEVMTAKDTKEAMTIIRNNQIDLALIDVMLGESKTGFDLFYDIIDYNNRIKCIFLTAVSSIENKRLELIAKHPHDYIEKPFDNNQLLQAVENSLTNSMIGKKLILGYGEIAIEKSPTLIQTTLGSCVAITLYDEKTRIGGMTHIMYKTGKHNYDTRGADNAPSIILQKIKEYGIPKSRMICKIFGGSQMHKKGMPVGKINVDEAKKFLKKENIKITEEDTGGYHTRIVCLNLADGNVEVTALGKDRS